MKNNLIDSLLLCPVCNEPLSCDALEKVYSCTNNHCFDLSKDGYVNLLTPDKKKSKNPGDSKEMVLARTFFLSKGYYQPVSEKINSVIAEYLSTLNKDSINVLDLGCGEGYYLNNLIDFLNDASISANYFGIDISKKAIKHASKAKKEARFIVGNNFSLPFADHSLDCILSVFSPIELTECKRVLKDNGLLIRVFPEKNHLIQLKEIIYSKIINKEYKAYKVEKLEMHLVNQVDVTYDIELKKDDIENLLLMTPHFWRVKRENIEKLKAYSSLHVTVDMCIGVFKKAEGL